MCLVSSNCWDARAVLGAFAKGRSSVPSLSSALFEKRQLFKWLETGWCDGSTSHLNETQPTHLPEVFTKGLTASVYHRTSTRRCQNRLPSQIGVGIISMHVYAEKVLLCRHLGQPREVHHVVFNERSGTDGRWKCAPASKGWSTLLNLSGFSFASVGCKRTQARPSSSRYLEGPSNLLL